MTANLLRSYFIGMCFLHPSVDKKSFHVITLADNSFWIFYSKIIDTEEGLRLVLIIVALPLSKQEVPRCKNVSFWLLYVEHLLLIPYENPFQKKILIFSFISWYFEILKIYVFFFYFSSQKEELIPLQLTQDDDAIFSLSRNDIKISKQDPEVKPIFDTIVFTVSF